MMSAEPVAADDQQTLSPTDDASHSTTTPAAPIGYNSALPFPTTASTTSITPTTSTTTATASSQSSPSLPAAVIAHVWWFGTVVLHGLEYVGEALADFLGITSSPYQYVIDAKERQERWQRMEDAEEDAARVKFEEEQRQQQTQQQSSMEEGHTTALAAVDTTAAASSPAEEVASDQGGI